jgi:flavin-binding protein dodecin
LEYNYSDRIKKNERGNGMSVIKVIEVLADSKVSWEDATKTAVREANKTVHGIKSVYVRNMRALVEDGEVIGYRVNAKISFEVEA